MAPRKDPSGYVWLAASLRSTVDRLTQDTNRAVELQLPELASKLTDASVELCKVYAQLLELASPAGPQKSKNVPF